MTGFFCMFTLLNSKTMNVTLNITENQLAVLMVWDFMPHGVLFPFNSLSYFIAPDTNSITISGYSGGRFYSVNTLLSDINNGEYSTNDEFEAAFSGFFSSASREAGLYSGWAEYQDTQYTVGSPFVLTTDNKVSLPNNRGVKLDMQKPIDIPDFYDGTYITGRLGDGINITIAFSVMPSTATITKITTAIDIGGSIGEIYTQDLLLTKGNGVEHYYLSSFNAYMLDTWVANGGVVKITANHGASVYNIRYLLTRTHKGRL